MPNFDLVPIIYLVSNNHWVPNLMFLYLPKFYYRAEMKLVPKLIRAELHNILKNWCRSSRAEVNPCRSSIVRYVAITFI